MTDEMRATIASRIALGLLLAGAMTACSGDLRISGRRLDAAAPPLRDDVPDGYGSTGFQASGVHFPTEGCWEVTGDLGTATTLSFVTFVIKRG